VIPLGLLFNNPGLTYARTDRFWVQSSSFKGYDRKIARIKGNLEKQSGYSETSSHAI
jgi:hypothetical protein